MKSKTNKAGARRSSKMVRCDFRAGTGLMGGTEPGQRVTPGNAHRLPPGSVVRLGNGGRLIRLHDDFWLWCTDHAHCYDRLENLKWKIDGEATACHVAPNAPMSGAQKEQRHENE